MQMYAFACKTSSNDVSRTVVSLIYAHCRSLGLEGWIEAGFGISFSADSELEPMGFEGDAPFGTPSAAVADEVEEVELVSGGRAV